MTQLRTQSRSNSKPHSAIVLFGIDENGKPKAARFRASDATLAKKAARQLQLQVLTVSNRMIADVVAKLPAGRIHATGRSIIPTIRTDLYSMLVAAAGQPPTAGGLPAQQPPIAGSTGDPPNGNKKGSTDRLPKTWDEIAPGHAVIAHESADDGWYDAIVVERTGDMCVLKWRDYPRERRFLKHYRTLALLCPNPKELSEPARRDRAAKVTASKTANTKPVPAAPGLPGSWGDIDVGHLVLAKHDGPWPAWWEAIPTEAHGDTLALRWRDYAQLPTVSRPRASLALLCPTAK